MITIMFWMYNTIMNSMLSVATGTHHLLNADLIKDKK